MKSSFAILVALVATVVASAGSPAHAGFVYDVASDFSFNNNPNGAWTYGWSSSLGGEFIVDVHKRTFDGGLQQWMGNPNGNAEDYGHPSVFYNPNPVPTGNGYAVPVNGVAFHPGLNGAHTAILWTAQEAGTYDLSSTFTKLHHGVTDVYIFKNNTELFAGSTGLSPVTYNSQLVLNAGDTIKFMAGSGIDGYYGDTTGVAATIAAVPEPSSMSLALVASSLLFAFRSKRFNRR